MRNRKLLYLTDAAQKAHDSLTEYLRHLDARETDPNYVHARMLFDEGWRYYFDIDAGAASPDDKSCTLWMTTDEESPSPVRIETDEISDTEVLKALNLNPSDETTAVLRFLEEMTQEIGVFPPLSARSQKFLKTVYGHGSKAENGSQNKTE